MPTEFLIIIKPTTRTATKQPTATPPHFFAALSQSQPHTISLCSESTNSEICFLSHSLCFLYIISVCIPNRFCQNQRNWNSFLILFAIYRYLLWWERVDVGLKLWSLSCTAYILRRKCMEMDITSTTNKFKLKFIFK